MEVNPPTVVPVATFSLTELEDSAISVGAVLKLLNSVISLNDLFVTLATKKLEKVLLLIVV